MTVTKKSVRGWLMRWLPFRRSPQGEPVRAGAPKLTAIADVVAKTGRGAVDK